MPRGTERRTPTQDQLRAAYGKTIRDVIASDLRILFVGINPGLYSAAVGHHFARPGNRFWPALQGAGFTDRLLSPSEERLLLDRGYGITNMVNRATARADELTKTEFSSGIRGLEKKVRRFRPRWVTFLGISAYQAVVDRQATKNRRGGRIAERTFVQTLGPEQNGDFSPVLSGSSEAPECTPTWRCGVRFAAEY